MSGFLGLFGWRPKIRDDRALAAALREIASKHDQPALAAALIRGRAIVAKAAVGLLVHGESRAVAQESRFHLGSTTKTMTSLLIAILVRERKLAYDTPLSAALPDIPMRDEYRRATLRDLVLSSAGIMPMQDPSQEDPAVVKTIWQDIPREHDDALRQRQELARITLDLPPLAMPGTKHVYSNVGWAIAALAAETAAGESYESLLQNRIFRPLDMTTARIGGWPASATEPDQPRGHYSLSGQLRPQPLDDEYVFPAWMNPSGGVHCSIEDFAKYARETLRGRQGQGALLDDAGYREIHSVHATVRMAEMYGPSLALMQSSHGSDVGAATSTMGYGWGVVPLEEGLLSIADGSGGTFFARIVVFPALDAAFVGATSAGSGSQALDAAIEAITGLEWRS
jgi:CubicO group peptidase (beta-lactamase class C family)